MQPGFNPPIFKVATSDGRNFVLLEPVVYLTGDGSKACILPAGATSDGASTPPEIWLNFPPFGGYWQAAFLHDCAYRDTLQNPDGTWSTLPKDDCDALLKDAMTVAGTHTFTKDAIYEGVALGGASSFANDRRAGRGAFLVNLDVLFGTVPAGPPPCSTEVAGFAPDFEP